MISFTLLKDEDRLPARLSQDCFGSSFCVLKNDLGKSGSRLWTVPSLPPKGSGALTRHNFIGALWAPFENQTPSALRLVDARWFISPCRLVNSGSFFNKSFKWIPAPIFFLPDCLVMRCCPWWLLGLIHSYVFCFFLNKHDFCFPLRNM